MKFTICTLLLLSLSEYTVDCFRSKGTGYRASVCKVLFGLTSGKAEWAADDEGPGGFKGISSQRKLNATFVKNLVR